MRARVGLGSRVGAGQVLFEVSSPEFLETCKRYFQSQSNYEKLRSDYQRKKTLQASGIISQKELNEAFTEAENARQEKEYAESAIRVYGMNPASVKMGQPMKIVAPISGEIVKCGLTPGAFLKADSDPVLAIADLRKVWVTAQVKERYIGAVDKGASAEIHTESSPGEPIHGKVIYVGNLVDEQTRSVQVVISCDNRDAVLKHGMYVSVHFLSAAKESVLVPSTAVFQGDSKSYVFVAADKSGTFIRRDVVTGSSSDDKTRIMIEEGLEEGETILAEGGLFLNN